MLHFQLNSKQQATNKHSTGGGEGSRDPESKDMTEMFDFGWSERPYWDRKNWSSLESYKEALRTSSTLYVGNLSFYTQESQIYALFDQVSTWPNGPPPPLHGTYHQHVADAA